MGCVEPKGTDCHLLSWPGRLGTGSALLQLGAGHGEPLPEGCTEDQKSLLLPRDLPTFTDMPALQTSWLMTWGQLPPPWSLSPSQTRSWVGSSLGQDQGWGDSWHQ